MHEEARSPRPHPRRYQPRIPASAVVTTQGMGGISQSENPEIKRSSEKFRGHTISPAIPRVTSRKVKRPNISCSRRTLTMPLNQSATLLPLIVSAGKNASPKMRNGSGRFVVHNSGGVMAQSGSVPRNRMRKTTPSAATSGQRSRNHTDCGPAVERAGPAVPVTISFGRRTARQPPAGASGIPPRSPTRSRRSRACPGRSPDPQHLQCVGHR